MLDYKQLWQLCVTVIFIYVIVNIETSLLFIFNLTRLGFVFNVIKVDPLHETDL